MKHPYPIVRWYALKAIHENGHTTTIFSLFELD